METQTKQKMKTCLSGIIAGVILAGSSALAGDNDYHSSTTSVKTVQAAKKPLTHEQLREERRLVNYTNLCTFANNDEDETTDKYFPVEDLLKNNGDNWTVLYTDANTKRVMSADLWNPQVLRDLSTNQIPFAEKLNCRYSFMQGREVCAATIHLRPADRIHGGMGCYAHGKGRARYQIQTVDLESLAEEKQ